MKNTLSNSEIFCPKCKSNHNKKNGFRRQKQCYLCKNCGKQFVLNPTPQGYSEAVKELCIKMYLIGTSLMVGLYIQVISLQKTI